MQQKMSALASILVVVVEESVLNATYLLSDRYRQSTCDADAINGLHWPARL